MDMIRAGHGKPSQPGGELYTPRHLQLLRLAGYLIQSGDARLLDALEVLLGALLSADRSRWTASPQPFCSRIPETPSAPIRTGVGKFLAWPGYLIAFSEFHRRRVISVA